MIDHQPSPSRLQLYAGDARDLDQVIEVMQAAFDPQFGEAWTRSQCAGILPLSGVALHIARFSPSTPAIGFSLSRVNTDEAELLLLAVAPKHRGRGIGKALVDKFIEYAGECGARHLHLEVRDGNPAIHIYRIAGFDLARRRSQYYRGRDDQMFDALTFVLAKTY